MRTAARARTVAKSDAITVSQPVTKSDADAKSDADPDSEPYAVTNTWRDSHLPRVVLPVTSIVRNADSGLQQWAAELLTESIGNMFWQRRCAMLAVPGTTLQWYRA